MRSILRGLYSGDIVPSERRAFKKDAETIEAARTIDEEEGYFAEKLSPDDRVRFQALSDTYMRMCWKEEENAFCDGFALGMLPAMDVMEEAETVISK